MVLKPIRWVGSSKEDLRGFPAEARRDIGLALHFAQAGDKHPSAKPLRGFGGAGVLEVIENLAGDTYRAVYTVRFTGVVYVLHCFQKKSKQSIKTPLQDLNLIKDRLKRASEDYLRGHVQEDR